MEFQATSEISLEKTWTWLSKGNFKRETESLQIVAHNDAIRINYVQAKMVKIRQNNKGRLCGDKDETTDDIVSECSKLAPKEFLKTFKSDGQVLFAQPRICHGE